ncbi:GTPase Era [Ancylomarina sp. 16SWW S1-10-2]|uniref:GTPase Era n=1 Tax=Ancylomarina sp. 16SWW S1-10-2 TaxID=2499681 RepID=UPI0012ADACC6|nr:GTPase Era [Ancylomarina sp. 16SWW S1-10-2]MRT94494.1 GTPase Era [Ancylomarina sp. 16SWW S1-10-2]
MSEKTPHKSGFVNIIGNPNVGKSTLMNNLVGERISIITSKSQTTRHRIKGIVNGDDFQIVYSDTPGVLKPNYKLQESMMKFSTSALVDADIIIYVTDVIETIDKNEEFLKKVQNSTVPVLLIINKIDLSDQAKLTKLFDIWKEKIPQAEIFPMSAKENFNVENLFNRILELLPVAPPYFAKDEVTDLPSKFFVTEIIREKVLMNYDKEVPYSVEIEVEEYKDEPKLLRIMAVINVERTSQKGIIIGHKGGALKKVGTEARMDIEAFFGKKVFLQLYVKVAKDWRSKDSQLKNFGYQK